LPAGTVAINVSLDDLDETALLETDRLFVDDWELIVADDNRLLGRLARAGRVVGPDETPTGSQRRVDGTLGELLAGHCQGRGAASDKVVVNPFGMAITDIALARLVHQVGVQRGLGTVLARGEVA
jgi:N-[(2S)-2-amino-2-carboxyethyl]-L-glutamate dehydrogenase